LLSVIQPPSVLPPTTKSNLPTDLKDAFSRPDRLFWIEATRKELKECFSRGTFRRIDQERGNRSQARGIRLKFVFTIKSDGRYKVRLVACGYSQVHKRDYDDIFSPTVNFRTTTTILHIAANKNYRIALGDIGNAYLESAIDYPIIMDLPNTLGPYLETDLWTVRVEGALYGLKQAGRLWHHHFTNILFNYGFKSSIYDPCFFTKIENGQTMYLILYVDDILVVSSNQSLEDHFFSYLNTQFKSVKRFNDNLTFLGIKITRDESKHQIYLSQLDYAQAIVDFHLDPSIPVSTFPISKIDLSKCKIEPQPLANTLIGKLRYLADRTRPDLLYSLSYLSKFIDKPSQELMTEITRIIRYIKGTVNHQLILGSGQPITLMAMSDASFVSSGDCHSQLGFCIYLSDDSGTVSAKSKTNSCINISSTHAEVDALIEAIKEIMWYQGFLRSINIELQSATVIHVDNKPTVTLSQEGNHMKRSRHFIVKSSYIKELVQNGTISIVHLPGKQNHSDIFTKPLFGESLQFHTDGILGKK
jgi:hypothetical protein